MRVFISTSTFAEHDKTPLKLLQDAGVDVAVNPYRRKLTADECRQLYQDIDGLIAGTESLTSEILRSAKRLRVLSRCGAGTDNVDMKAAKELGIKVFNTPDAPTQAVAELAIGLMLDLLRGISTADRQIRASTWSKNMGHLLKGKTLGIVGLGRIGRRVVALTETFHPHYIACDVAPDRQFGDKYNIKFVSLEALLKRADIISVHLPYGPELKGIISAEKIGLMKPEAFLINTARGELVDEAALNSALKEKRIAGAALDVFGQEPYTGPLKERDNVILTPHIGSYAEEARVEMEVQAVKNLLQGLEL
jgi:D-3-phosphoglycerate dehydrogenase